ncbi:MAG: tRNA (N(6)-L-threonylcarbamoyladenosine(37)-C(2))-methylthiotransferase MtaB [Bdellovibrionaceae bacterium]|nr:tRNA (N(6)-L-threonylcarbamoyladenosine(37)-C(2))-methylthiotransferase MtaB [Pseudobdellovibrionaceae bacterium]
MSDLSETPSAPHKDQDLTYKIHTFGCKVNTYDTSLLQSKISALKPNEGEKEVHVHILNSCAVTHEATKEAGKLARTLKRQDKNAMVVLTGCAAQVDKKFFKDNQDIDLIVGNSHKGDLEGLILKKLNHEMDEKTHQSNIFKKEDLEFGAGLEASHTRAFLKIQDGCNSFCSFCVIPFARGKSRSVEIQKLVGKVNEFYEKGLREVILTGVHVGDYEDQDKRLEDLIEALLADTDMPRFRLTSLEPIELSDRLLDSYKNPRMCPHFHMSIQSAQTRVLKDMKRKYTAEDVKRSLQKIAQYVPNAFVGMDVIVGFPGETEAEFRETYDRLASLPWTRIHVFPYSPRPQTRALMMEGGHDRSLILERSKQLRELSHQRWNSEAMKQVGTTKEVLLLSKNTDQYTHSLSRDYWNVLIDESDLQKATLDPMSQELKVQITEAFPTHNGQGYLKARVVL